MIVLMKNRHFQSQIGQKVLTFVKISLNIFDLEFNSHIDFCTYLQGYNFHFQEGVGTTTKDKLTIQFSRQISYWERVRTLNR